MVREFEELVAWQAARSLTADVYRATGSREWGADRALRDQARRAAVSMMANIAEGFERAAPADFARFLTIAKASCAELRSHLYVALDVGLVSEPDFRRLMQAAMRAAQITGALRSSVARHAGRGGRPGTQHAARSTPP